MQGATSVQLKLHKENWSYSCPVAKCAFEKTNMP